MPQFVQVADHLDKPRNFGISESKDLFQRSKYPLHGDSWAEPVMFWRGSYVSGQSFQWDTVTRRYWNCGLVLSGLTPSYPSSWHEHNPQTSGVIDVPNAEELIIIPLRELSYEEARDLIIEYIQKAENKKVYMSDIAEELRISLRTIIRVFSELGIT